MKKPLVWVAVSVAVALLAVRLWAKMENVDWAKKFEGLPDNAPPKWMFRNISAIRENTDRILSLLEGQSGGSRPEAKADSSAPLDSPEVRTNDPGTRPLGGNAGHRRDVEEELHRGR